MGTPPIAQIKAVHTLEQVVVASAVPAAQVAVATLLQSWRP